jgi:hypothetical protein
MVESPHHPNQRRQALITTVDAAFGSKSRDARVNEISDGLMSIRSVNGRCIPMPVLFRSFLPRDRCRFGNETRCSQARLNSTIHPRRYMRPDSVASATGTLHDKLTAKSWRLQWTSRFVARFSLCLCSRRNGSIQGLAICARGECFFARTVAQVSQLAASPLE